jgi:cobalt-zinc-cadmium efflux system outer membrane protein
MDPSIRAVVFGASFIAVVTAGCQTPDPSARTRPLPAPPAAVTPAASPAAAVAVVPAAGVAPAGDGPTGVVQAAVLSTGAPAAAGPLGLDALERIALTQNPTLTQAAAYIDASRGRAYQAGLWLNPTVGYSAEQIGTAGTAGEFHGGFVQQTIVTGGKLRLSRAKYNQQTVEAELQALGQQFRVLNAVRTGYYDLLATSRMIAVRKNLLANAQETFKTSKEMFNTGLSKESDVLLAENAVSRARIDLTGVENDYAARWRHLAAILGQPDMPPATLADRLVPDGPPLEWESSLAHLLQDSPELQAAKAHVALAEITVQREKAEPIPNINLQSNVGYNFETRSTVAYAQFSLPIPLWNKNRGTIREAVADLARAQAEVQRLELDLGRRLADTFNLYRTAMVAVTAYRDTIVPNAEKAYKVQLEMYEKRRIAWPEVVTLEQNLFVSRSEYTRSLMDLRRAEVAITGLLLTDGLMPAPGPVPGGHIDSNPTPR